MTTISAEQRQAMTECGGEPLRLVDPLTNRAYVLLAEDAFDKRGNKWVPCFQVRSNR